MTQVAPTTADVKQMRRDIEGGVVFNVQSLASIYGLTLPAARHLWEAFRARPKTARASKAG